MTTRKARWGVLGACAVLVTATLVHAQDWPQWRGPNRDAKATFTAPKTWPKELTQKWKVKVGDGVATPALVGDKLYVFSRDGNDEVLRCLDAGTGKEVWQAKDPQVFRSQGGDTGYQGPRCSPAVAEGKVVTLGVNGNLVCYDAASGNKLWGKDDFKNSFPRFHTSSSPIIADGLCVAQLGGQNIGAVVAYELGDGKEKWKRTDDGTAYASPALLTVGGLKVLVAEGDKSVVALNLSDGKLLWQTPYPIPQGRGRSRPYNASSPMVEGQTLILTGSLRGVKAFKIDKEGDAVTGKELWTNTDNSTQFNTPVLAKGHLFGLSDSDKLFCINAETGKTAWSAALGAGGGRGQAGYGSIVDAGPVLMALTPATDLVVFEPDAKELKQVAKYKVGDSRTYAYPIVSGNRIFVKDNDSVILWTIE